MLSLIDEINSFCRVYVNDKSERTPERNEKIKAAYKELTGENIRGSCGTCLIEAILLINKKTIMEPCKYKLKKGARLQAFGNFSKNATNKNLTNELAEWHLRLNPTCAKRFEVLPSTSLITPQGVKIIPPRILNPEPEIKVEPEIKAEPEVKVRPELKTKSRTRKRTLKIEK